MKKEEEEKKQLGKGREIDCLCIDSEFSFIINFLRSTLHQQ